MALVEELGNLVQEDGDAVGTAFVHGLADVATDEQADRLEVLWLRRSS